MLRFVITVGYATRSTRPKASSSTARFHRIRMVPKMLLRNYKASISCAWYKVNHFGHELWCQNLHRANVDMVTRRAYNAPTMHYAAVFVVVRTADEVLTTA